MPWNWTGQRKHLAHLQLVFLTQSTGVNNLIVKKEVYAQEITLQTPCYNPTITTTKAEIILHLLQVPCLMESSCFFSLFAKNHSETGPNVKPAFLSKSIPGWQIQTRRSCNVEHNALKEALWRVGLEVGGGTFQMAGYSTQNVFLSLEPPPKLTMAP